MKVDLGAIQATQEKLLSYSASAPKQPAKVGAHPLLRDAVNYDDKLMQMALGSFGTKLKRFANLVDLEHPDVSRVLDGLFTEDNPTAQRMYEFLKVAKYCSDQHLEVAARALSRAAMTGASCFNKRLEDPRKNLLNVRLLKSPNDVAHARACKMAKAIEFNHGSTKADFGWQEVPSEFSMYYYFNSKFDNEIKKLEERGAVYEQLDYSRAAQQIRSSIESLKRSVDEGYLGFYRVTIMTAALIAAKMHGFSCVPGDGIKIPAVEFGSEELFDDMPINGVRLRYEPWVYPLSSFADTPKSIKDFIAYLDKHPQLNGKPAFDHYMVMLPSVALDSSIMQSFCFSKFITTPYDAHRIFIKEKASLPIILGEHDNKCYFLCYWIE